MCDLLLSRCTLTHIYTHTYTDGRLFVVQTTHCRTLSIRIAPPLNESFLHARIRTLSRETENSKSQCGKSNNNRNNTFAQREREERERAKTAAYQEHQQQQWR